MDEILKKLIKDKVLTEDTKAAILEAFSKSVEEAKVAQEEKIRGELAEQYEKDREAIHTAFEKFLEQELHKHVANLREGVEEVNTLKAKYASKATKLKESAQKYVRDRTLAMEKAIEDIIKREVSELHESEVTNRRAYITAINEKTAELESDRDKLRTKAAKVIEHIINTKVQGHLEELAEDIKAARQADFGRDIFETFYTQFRRQFFDSNTEFRALASKLKEAEATANKVKKTAAKKIAEAKERAKVAEAARSKVVETVQRTQKINNLTKGLSGKSRTQMRTILEATKDTSKLDQTYRRFLKDVLKETKGAVSSPAKSKLDEAVFEIKTGGRQQIKEAAPSKDDDDIVDIKRLAGNAA